MAEIPEIGLVFGKFYPLTRGHQYLIDSARARCRRLFVGISGRASETIPQATRAGWIRTLYPDVVVVEQPSTLPYFPEECSSAEEFYGIWTRALQEVCGGRSPDVLFTSEDYGPIMAGWLNCPHMMIDRQRQTVPISATRVRNDPFACWDFLDPVVRAYFVKVVCVFGPESTGKTTLCENLARHYNTVWQPEWARDYLGDRHCVYEDMEKIVRGHFAEHSLYRQKANRILIMDTDAITTSIFSNHYYGRCPEYVTEMANQMHHLVDHYLLTDIDVPWVPDTSRDLGAPHLRQLMMQTHLDELRRRDLPYTLIRGNWDQRLAAAIQAIDTVIFAK